MLPDRLDSLMRIRLLLAAAFAASVAAGQTYNFDSGVGNTPMAPDFGTGNPFSTVYSCAATQRIFTAAELTAAGVPAGARILSTWFLTDDSTGLSWNECSVRASLTPNSYFSTDPKFGVTEEFFLTDVHIPAPYSDVLGWNILDSDVHFYWDGTSNVCIEIACKGAAQFPGGPIPPNGPVGPVVRGTTYATPGGPGTFESVTVYGDHSAWPYCYPIYGSNVAMDMRLVFSNAPLNDDCTQAVVVGAGVFGGTIAGASTAALAHADPSIGLTKDVWYRFSIATPSDVTFYTCGGATFDSVLALYSGTCGALTFLGSNDDACTAPGDHAGFTFHAQPGVDYFVALGKAAMPAPGTGTGETFLLGVAVSPSATATAVGTGCAPGSNLVPTLSGTTPMLGEIGTISLTGGNPTSIVILLLGVPSAPTPFLDSGCSLHLNPSAITIFQLGMTDAAGAWSFSDLLPNSPALVGVTLGVQAVLYSPFAAPLISVTNGVVLQFGQV